MRYVNSHREHMQPWFIIRQAGRQDRRGGEGDKMSRGGDCYERYFVDVTLSSIEWFNILSEEGYKINNLAYIQLPKFYCFTRQFSH